MFLWKHCQNKNLIKTIAFLFTSFKHKHTNSKEVKRGLVSYLQCPHRPHSMPCLGPLNYILRLLEFVLFLLFITFRYICLFLLLVVLLEWKFNECEVKITKFIGAVLHFFDLKACSKWKVAVWYYMYYNFKKSNTQTARWRTVCFPFKIIYTPIYV